MKKIISFVILVAGYLSATGQTLNISFKDGRQCQDWKNNLSTKEIGKISHTNDVVSIKMKSGPTYVFGIDSIDRIDNTPAEDLSAHSNGDLLEVTSEEDWDNDTLFANYVYQEGTNELIPYIRSGMMNLISKLKNSRKDTPYTLHYHIYNIDYVSSDIDGQKIRLSGRIVFPYSVNDGELSSLKLSHLFLENHYTSLRKDQAPTSSFTNMTLAGMLAKGYLLVQPDYLGLGKTDNRTQLFFCHEVMSRNNVDCLLATMQLVKLANSDDKYVDIQLADDAQIINEGISQGASVALGVHRYMENSLTEEETAALPKIKETRVCAGCYDPFLTMERYAAWDSLTFCSTVPILLQGTILAYPDLMVDDKGNRIEIDQFFCDKFLTERYSEYGNMTVLEMISSKQYDAWIPCYPMWQTYGNPTRKKAKFAAFMNPEMFENDTLLNLSNPIVIAMKNAFEKSNITYGWSPVAPVNIWHGPHDNFIPYENATEFVQGVKAVNPEANVTLTDIDDDGLGTSTHSICDGVWALSEIQGININYLMPFIKILM